MKIENETIEVSRRLLFSLAESVLVNADAVEKRGNRMLWNNKTPSECLRGIAEVLKKESQRS